LLQHGNILAMEIDHQFFTQDAGQHVPGEPFGNGPGAFHDGAFPGRLQRAPEQLPGYAGPFEALRPGPAQTEAPDGIFLAPVEGFRAGYPARTAIFPGG